MLTFAALAVPEQGVKRGAAMTKLNANSRMALTRARLAIRDDHRRLDEMAVNLQKASDRPALASVLETMYPVLLAHFAHEERPRGLFSALELCIPEHRESLQRLIQEHQKFASSIASILQRAKQKAENGWAFLVQE